MQIRDALFLPAALSHLSIAVLAARRTRKSPLGLPLACMALDFFGWNFASFCNHALGLRYANSVDAILTALGPALVLHVVLAFVGKTAAHRRTLQLAYVAVIALALSAASSLVCVWGRRWIDSVEFAGLFALVWLPSLGLEAVMLHAHWRLHPDAEERTRTRVFAAALGIAAVCAVSDVARDLGADVPGLGPLGAFISAILIAFATLRRRLLDRNFERVTALYIGSIAVVATLALLLLVRFSTSNLIVVGTGSLLLSVAALLTLREAMGAQSERRARLQQLAVVGRFSAQMTHDLKNPLSALLGAVQILEAEDNPTTLEFTQLIAAQAKRIQVIVEEYDRIGRVEPICRTIALNAFVTRIAQLKQLSAPAGVTIDVRVADGAAEADLDADLITGALENLLQNAFEASARATPVTLDVSIRADRTGDREVVFAVTDHGEGMDPRQKARAFEDFYTSKAGGSGLGLAFVRRVALAHGGDAYITSTKGKGSCVELRLPIETGSNS
jgi:two-component system, NtrC family, sensor histidine kinase HydH